MTYKYHIIDAAGRLWAKTLTRIKAAKLVEMLKKSKNLNCSIKENN